VYWNTVSESIGKIVGRGFYEQKCQETIEVMKCADNQKVVGSNPFARPEF